MKLGLILLIGLPLLGTGAGYGIGRFVLGGRASHAAPAMDSAPQPVALGQFAVQIYHAGTISTLVTSTRITVKGAAAAARYGEPANLARLRDAGYAALLDAAETPAFTMGPVAPQAIADALRTGLAHACPDLASVEILSAVSSDQPRT